MECLSETTIAARSVPAGPSEMALLRHSKGCVSMEQSVDCEETLCLVKKGRYCL